SINANNGALSLVSGVLLGAGGQVGPIALAAEPQGQFVYAMLDGLVPVAFDGTTGALTVGTPIAGVFAGGSSGGVGDRFSFAASGASLVWQDGCTVLVDDVFVFAGCPHGFPSSGGGGGGGGGGSTPPPPAATHVLTVHLDPAWGGNIVSTPPGI